MSEVLESLRASSDPLDVEMARAWTAWQNARASQGKHRVLGYEPREIKSLGLVEVISRRVRNGSDGFDEVGPLDSYEAIVCKYPNRFAIDVQEIAKRRMGSEIERFAPTADIQLGALLSKELRLRNAPGMPVGVKEPQSEIVSVRRFCRDPKIQAYVHQLAKGRCELCDNAAPFNDESGFPFLEIHHVKPLARGGSDRVSNTVALCPNCHRALHWASNFDILLEKLFSNVSRLIPE